MRNSLIWTISLLIYCGVIVDARSDYDLAKVCVITLEFATADVRPEKFPKLQIPMELKGLVDSMQSDKIRIKYEVILGSQVVPGSEVVPGSVYPTS